MASVYIILFNIVIVTSADIFKEIRDEDAGCTSSAGASISATAFDNWLMVNDINIPPSLKNKLEENYIASKYVMTIVLYVCRYNLYNITQERYWRG